MLTHKSKKYDRQLRLWAEHGQALLEGARIALVNGSAVGTEVVKNLVLPGAGAFTVVDGKKVSRADLGNNFFVDEASVGTSRARRTTQLLQELNDDVMGSFLEEDPEHLIETNPEYFGQFTIVIATELAEAPLLKLAALCWRHAIPLVVARTNGLIGYLRLVVPEHTVVESHPDNPLFDLRLDNPPAELVALASKTNLEAMDLAQHKHVPYVILLCSLAQKWKQLHGRMPETRPEKDQFKLFIQQHKIGSDEQNFDEAVAAAHRVWTATTIPSEVKAILADAKCEEISASTSNFWILARALRDFVQSPAEGNGYLPVTGTVPDMESDTDSYVTLQNVYRALAQRDIEAVTQRVHGLLQLANKPIEAIPNDEIKLFCKNAFNLRLVRFRSLQEEYSAPKTTLLSNGCNDPSSNVVWYLALRAASQFEQLYKRYPGQTQDIEADIPLAKKVAQELVATKLGLSSASIPDEFIHELCRYGGSELHSLAAYIGGVASQEAIKLITHQFVPMNNTHIFNGINSSTTTEAF